MAGTTSAKRKSQQRAFAFRLLLLLGILIGINIIAARIHFSFDLTQERRFTLADASKRFLGDMDETATVDVFLQGKDFPAGFQRLQESVREHLQSMQNAAGNKISFRFRDPFDGVKEEDKERVFQNLASKGVSAMTLNVNKDDGYSQQVIIPYAMVNYKGREMAVHLIEQHMGMTPLEVLNYSEALLEYKFVNALRQLSMPNKPTIAYLVGHGEPIGADVYDAHVTLRNYYNLDTLILDSTYYIPNAYSAVIVCGPTLPFDEKAKFKIDQYIMRGGSVLWMLDNMQASMDSLQGGEQFISTNYNLNLEDMLFKYGVRINSDLIEDLNCNVIPVVVGMNGDQPQTELKPWQYFPLFGPTERSANHPIVNNLDNVMSMFVSSIDTVANDIKKTVLLTSSKYSRAAPSPVRVSLSMLRVPAKAELYNNSYRPAAVLLEGRFQSIFKNLISPTFAATLRDSLKMPFKEAADTAGRMIVVSDADMMMNYFSPTQGPMEMGYWRFTKERHANKTFLLNCMEYLTDNSGLLAARSKEVKLRQLDPGKVKAEQTTWQLINIGIPLALVAIFGSVYMFLRKRRYEVKEQPAATAKKGA